MFTKAEIEEYKRHDASTLLKKKVLLKSKGICAVCGIFRASEVHHIVPLCDGGENKEENLVALCDFCHDCVPGDRPDGYIDEFGIYKSSGGILWFFFRMGFLMGRMQKTYDYKEFIKATIDWKKSRRIFSKNFTGMRSPADIHIMMS